MMEVNYYFFDMDVFKNILYFSKEEFFVLLWICWYYFFDIMCRGRVVIV